MAQKGYSLRLRNGRLEEMDFAKGISILGIVIMHLIQNYITAAPAIVSKGVSLLGSGVHVFILCSGLGLYLSHLKRSLSFGQFIKRRLLKIYVPYILVVVCAYFIPWIDQRPDRLQALLSHVFLYKMFIPEYEGSLGGHFWFISTIIQLYLAFIPLCRLKEKMKNDRLFFLLTLAVSAAWWVVTYLTGISEIRIWGSFFLQNLWEFALGMCLADCLYQGKSFDMRPLALLGAAAAGIGLQTVMALNSDALRCLNDVPALAGFCALLLLLYQARPVKKIGEWIASFSYELYLIHLMVMSVLFHLLAPETMPAQLLAGLVSLAVCLGAACGYHALLKKLRGACRNA